MIEILSIFSELVCSIYQWCSRSQRSEHNGRKRSPNPSRSWWHQSKGIRCLTFCHQFQLEKPERDYNSLVPPPPWASNVMCGYAIVMAMSGRCVFSVCCRNRPLPAVTGFVMQGYYACHRSPPILKRNYEQIVNVLLWYWNRFLIVNFRSSTTASTSHLNTNVSISIEDTTNTSSSQRNSLTVTDKKDRSRPESGNIELDSGSSSDESETEGQADRAPSPAVILPNRHQVFVGHL